MLCYLFLCTRQPASLLDFLKHPYEKHGLECLFVLTRTSNRGSTSRCSELLEVRVHVRKALVTLRTSVSSLTTGQKNSTPNGVLSILTRTSNRGSTSRCSELLEVRVHVRKALVTLRTSVSSLTTGQKNSTPNGVLSILTRTRIELVFAP